MGEPLGSRWRARSRRRYSRESSAWVSLTEEQHEGSNLEEPVDLLAFGFKGLPHTKPDGKGLVFNQT